MLNLLASICFTVTGLGALSNPDSILESKVHSVDNLLLTSCICSGVDVYCVGALVGCVDVDRHIMEEQREAILPPQPH